MSNEDFGGCRLEPTDSTNWERWGKLVTTWATGKNQFGDSNDYSIPATGEKLQTIGALSKDDFHKMLDKAGVVMDIPAHVTRFVFVQDDEATVIVRVPPKKMVEGAKKKIKDQFDADRLPIPYPFLPEFYADNWQNQTRSELKLEELLRMHAQRLGEYTINVCG